MIFQRGGGGPDPLSPPLDPHLSNNYLGRTIISLCTGNWWKIFKYFILKKKTPQVRLELAASEFVTLRYNHLPTLLYNTRLIAYTVFVLCSSTSTIGNTRKIAKYNELFRRKLFRPLNLFISTGLIFTSYIFMVVYLLVVNNTGQVLRSMYISHRHQGRTYVYANTYVRTTKRVYSVSVKPVLSRH